MRRELDLTSVLDLKKVRNKMRIALLGKLSQLCLETPPAPARRRASRAMMPARGVFAAVLLLLSCMLGGAQAQACPDGYGATVRDQTHSLPQASAHQPGGTLGPGALREV